MNKVLLLRIIVNNQRNQNEGCCLKIFYLLFETRKATGLINREFNQLTPKCQINFFNSACRKKSKTEQVNITIEFYIFEIVKVSNFKLAIWNCWTKLPQKEEENLKKRREKWKSPLNILLIRISLGSNFQLQQTILIFCNNIPNKDTSKQKQNNWISPLNCSYSNNCKYQIFTLNKQYRILGLNLTKTGISCHKQKKKTWTLNFAYSN